MQTFSDCNYSKATEANYLLRLITRLIGQGVKGKCVRCELNSESSSVAIPQSLQWFEGNEGNYLYLLSVLLKGVYRGC